MKTLMTRAGRLVLKGYSLVLLLVLWLMSIGGGATGDTLEPEYGVIVMYGAPWPYYCCTGSWDKTQDTSADELWHE